MFMDAFSVKFMMRSAGAMRRAHTQHSQHIHTYKRSSDQTEMRAHRSFVRPPAHRTHKVLIITINYRAAAAALRALVFV